MCVSIYLYSIFMDNVIFLNKKSPYFYSYWIAVKYSNSINISRANIYSFLSYLLIYIITLPNKAIFLVCSAIPPNEVLGFFSIKSYAVIGSVVPTTSPLMVRSESHNGASKKFLSESIFSVLLTRAALYYCFKFVFLVSSYDFEFSVIFIILMLYHIAFYDVTHRPYILESYIFLIPILSFYHPSFYPHPFSFASQPRIHFLF